MGSLVTRIRGLGALALATIVIAYVATALIGIRLPVGEGVVTPVWAPTGIAIGALVLLGIRAWPAVFVAAVVANAVAGASALVATGIAIGNTLEAVIATLLLARFGFAREFSHSRDVGLYVAVVLVATIVSACNGIAWLYVDGVVTAGMVGNQWLTWWLGDMVGAIIVAPFILAVAAAIRAGSRPDARMAIEFTISIAVVTIVTALVFSGEETRRPALLIPPWIWATLRFRAVGSSTATLAIGCAGLYGAFNNGFVVGDLSTTASINLLLAMLALVGISLLGVTAVLTEREDARRRLEAALRDEQQVADELRRLDEAKDRLLAAVSHELRTPLTSILALSSLLQDRSTGSGDDKSREMHELLESEARRLDRLLTDLLDLERLRMGMLDPRVEDVDVAELVRSVVERHVDGDRPTSVELDPVHIRVDASQLERIVDNLVANAVRHTPEHAAVFVEVRGVDDGGVLISVDDAGDGVPDEDKLSIFDPFTRGSHADEHAPGTGIGLSLVAHFAELNGGRAWVEDRRGGGASFRVQLPAERS